MHSEPSEPCGDDLSSLERMERWADRVLDDRAREGEHFTDDELFDLRAERMARDMTMRDYWLIASPDDPEMREHLIESEGCDEAFADAVLDKMREIGRRRGW
jgi:hypothetical protein